MHKEKQKEIGLLKEITLEFANLDMSCDPILSCV